MDPELLAQILAAQSPQLSPLALAATQGGVSRTTLGQLTDPNILLGTGVADPSAIASGLSQFTQQQFFDALDQYNRDVAAAQRKYTIEPPQLYSEVLDRYLSAPSGVQNVFSQIADGSLSAEQGRVALTSPLTAEELVSAGLSPQEAEQQAEKFTYKDVLQARGLGADWWERFSNDLSRFETEAAQYRREMMQFQDETARVGRELEAELTRLGPAPTPETFDSEGARLQYYKNIGLPGLALLPDPTVPYQIPEEFVMQRLREGRESGKTLAEELLASTQRSTPLGTSGQTFTERIVPPATPATPARIPAREVSGQRFVTPSGPVPNRATPALRAALAPNTLTRDQRIQLAAMREREAARADAAAIGRGLAAADRTPFQDAMAGLYGYGLTEARA
jgi:hypothetical protein